MPCKSYHIEKAALGEAGIHLAGLTVKKVDKILDNLKLTNMVLKYDLSKSRFTLPILFQVILA